MKHFLSVLLFTALLLPCFASARDFSGFSANVPAGWNVTEKDGEVTMSSPDKAAYFIIETGPVMGKNGEVTIQKMVKKLKGRNLELEDARTGCFTRDIGNGVKEQCEFLHFGYKYALVRYADRTKKQGKYAKAIEEIQDSLEYRFD